MCIAEPYSNYRWTCEPRLQLYPRSLIPQHLHRPFLRALPHAKAPLQLIQPSPPRNRRVGEVISLVRSINSLLDILKHHLNRALNRALSRRRLGRLAWRTTREASYLSGMWGRYCREQSEWKGFQGGCSTCYARDATAYQSLFCRCAWYCRLLMRIYSMQGPCCERSLRYWHL